MYYIKRGEGCQALSLESVDEGSLFASSDHIEDELKGVRVLISDHIIPFSKGEELVVLVVHSDLIRGGYAPHDARGICPIMVGYANGNPIREFVTGNPLSGGDDCGLHVHGLVSVGFVYDGSKAKEEEGEDCANDSDGDHLFHAPIIPSGARTASTNHKKVQS